MEKFNTWADSYTGVQPFLPLPSTVYSSSRSLFPYYIKWYLLSPLIGLLKIPFVLTVLGLLLAFDAVGNILKARWLLRLVHVSLGGLLLALWGFYSVDDKYQPSKRGNRTPSGKPGSGFGGKDIIIANRVSYVELVYLLYKFSPVFTAVPNTWNDEVPQNKVKVISFYQALSDTIYQPAYTEKQCQTLQTVLENSKAPIVVFPEGTTTNGKVLLGCVPLFTDPPLGKVHLIGFKYEYTDFSPVYPAGSFWKHLFTLTGQFYNSLQVRYLIDADLPNGDDSEWNERVYDLLGSLIGKRRAKITAKEKFEFLKYFNQYKKNYKK